MAKTIVNASEAFKDLRNGMSNNELMLKYKLSSRGLAGMFNKLNEVTQDLQWNGLVREIRAKEVLDDIRIGISDTDLMRKYKISALGLNNLFKELTVSGLLDQSRPRRRINANNLIYDIRRGLDEADLMEKYHLCLLEFQNLAKALLEAKLISTDDLLGLPLFSEAVSGPSKPVISQQFTPMISLKIWDVLDPDVWGDVMFLSPTSFRIEGLEAAVGETKTLVIQSSGFQDNKPLVLDAKCVGIRHDYRSNSVSLEFKLVNLASVVLREYKDLLDNYTVTETYPEYIEGRDRFYVGGTAAH
jgi:hypothetical protein